MSHIHFLKKTKNNIFRILNLAKCMDSIEGGVRKIKDINEIEHRKIFEDEQFEKAKKSINSGKITKTGTSISTTQVLQFKKSK